MEQLGLVPDKKAGLLKKMLLILAWVLFTLAISKQICSFSDRAWESGIGSAVKQGVVETQAKIISLDGRACCSLWNCKQKPESVDQFTADGGCIVPKEGYECICREWGIMPYTSALNDTNWVLKNVSYDIIIKGYELVREKP